MNFCCCCLLCSLGGKYCSRDILHAEMWTNARGIAGLGSIGQGTSLAPSTSTTPTTGSNYNGICRFFLSGGCVRGENCPYLHELPDERHLDVNGVGFIFHSNVQNTQGAALRKLTPPVKKQMPRYRPPEATLEHNLPPSLAPALHLSQSDVVNALFRALMDTR